MISCTEFIPSYSELFSFLEERYGFAEVERYWNDIFDPDRNGILCRKVREHGLRGCYEYWSYSLNEEAADFVMMLNEEDGWFTIRMRHCPSKGRLLSMKQIRPYDKYCLHCDLYRKTVERFGLRYILDVSSADRAQCGILIYDPEKFDGRCILTPQTEVMERRAGDNKYLHREFHNYMNMGVEYLGTRFGTQCVEDYLARFARNYYAPLIGSVRSAGLAPLADAIRATYEAEEAPSVLHLREGEGTLRVQVDACPAVRFLKESGRTPSRWYPCTTETVMRTIAGEAGLDFRMESYDPDTGAAAYSFAQRSGTRGAA